MNLVIAALKRVLAGSLPSSDYPPSNIKQMIDTCRAKGRSDLATKIQARWEEVFDKYPATRMNWAAASTIGNNSIKKNVFGGKSFVDWLNENLKEEMTSKEEKTLTGIDKPTIPEETPAIAIPKKEETPEDWAAEAKKTSATLKEARVNFRKAEDWISYLSSQVNDLSKKVSEYGPGGARSTTKSGKPTALSARVPKWEAQLKAYQEDLDLAKMEISEGASKLVAAEDKYNNTRVTTVKYEQKTQEVLSEILNFILELEDLKKKQELLIKFKNSLKEAESGKAVASVGETVSSIWSAIRGWFSQTFKMAKRVNKSVDSLTEWVSSF